MPAPANAADTEAPSVPDSTSEALDNGVSTGDSEGNSTTVDMNGGEAQTLSHDNFVQVAPRQPPLECTDAASMQLPEIVHGIDPEDQDTALNEDTEQSSSIRRLPSSTLPPPVAEMFSSLTARVQRAVRLAHAPGPPPAAPTLLLFGDSLTELSNTVSDPSAGPGWAALLREAYGDLANISVHGFSGYNSRWACHIFPRVLRSCIRATTSVAAVVILLGTNDACIPPALQHVPLREYSQNLTKLVRFVRTFDITPILLTPPPVVCPLDASQDDVGAALRPTDVVAEYANACKAVAEQTDCPIINLYAGFLTRAGPDGLDAMFTDGIHFSSSGNRTVFDLLYAALPSIVPQLDPSNLHRPFPHWSQIDPEDLVKSLGISELIDS